MAGSYKERDRGQDGEVSWSSGRADVVHVRHCYAVLTHTRPPAVSFIRTTSEA